MGGGGDDMVVRLELKAPMRNNVESNVELDVQNVTIVSIVT